VLPFAALKNFPHSQYYHFTLCKINICFALSPLIFLVSCWFEWYWIDAKFALSAFQWQPKNLPISVQKNSCCHPISFRATPATIRENKEAIEKRIVLAFPAIQNKVN
jgi:hypothetical protein